MKCMFVCWRLRLGKIEITENRRFRAQYSCKICQILLPRPFAAEHLVHGNQEIRSLFLDLGLVR